MIKKILVVDDEPNVLFVLKQSFRSGYTVLTATSGEQALEIIESEKPDFVFLDIKMPGISGMEVLGRITGTGAAPTVWMLTGDEELETAMKALEGGASGYLTKPFDVDKIRAIVAGAFETLEKKQGHDTSGEKPWRIKKKK